MGRNCGYLALIAGIAGGAEAITLPEVPTNPEEVAQTLQLAYEHGKSHAIVVAAEGADYNAAKLTEFFVKNEERLGFSVRSTILGHVQRGGTPSAYDRTLASRFGYEAIEAIDREEYGVLVGLQGGKVATTPLEDAVNKKKELDLELLKLAKLLD